ncbi:hypothetical protein [Chitinimonas sp. BJYL2]|uniref:hypothetical protein n=1 Tax=Chitinimonas sp. BJYL2 TaxID=2976696 RepID=UPI0022B41218|nr:hypothetical protein [Chitinimonas sp. BJYL2]
MSTTHTPATLAELARWLRVEEGDSRDRLELASAWQRMPDGSPYRLKLQFAAGIVLAILLLLFTVGLLSESPMALAIALMGGLLAAGVFWYVRAWFWRSVLELDARHLSLTYCGWGAPVSTILLLEQIDRLSYALHEGRLASLQLEHRDGELILPFSGQRELDKLYFNLLRHLLLKRRPAITIGESAPMHAPATESESP